MHKIAAKEFTLYDFSCEHLLNSAIDKKCVIEDTCDSYYELDPTDILDKIIEMLNKCRILFLETKCKKYWWQMIQLLPSSYNQKRTVMMNYEVLANIYKSRRNHKLDEWSIGFMDWIKTLPYSELITGPSLTDIPICNEIMEEAKKRVKQNQRCSEEVLKKVEQRIRMREESEEFFKKLREGAEKEGIR